MPGTDLGALWEGAKPGPPEPYPFASQQARRCFRDLTTGTPLRASDLIKNLLFQRATEEGLFAGTSSGANIVASLRVAERFGPDATVVTILCDSGLRYLSTDLYRET